MHRIFAPDSGAREPVPPGRFGLPVAHPYADADARQHACQSSTGILLLARFACMLAPIRIFGHLWHSGGDISQWFHLLHGFTASEFKSPKCCCKHGRVGRKGVGQEGGPLYICLYEVWSILNFLHTA